MPGTGRTQAALWTLTVMTISLCSEKSMTTAKSLLGRQRERAALSQLLFDVRSGRGRALVLRGEPGIGKTALLEDLCARADDVVLARVAGIESEMELAFAALQQLLCVIDDAQWLDRASAQTLAFVARRLLAEPVALVFATREPGEEYRGLP